MRVLIVGGGIGGLTLAQGLLKAGIDVKVVERQMEKSENLAGYGIHIDKNGRHALRSCLSLSNWTRLQARFSSAGTQLFFRDTQLRVLAEKDDAVLSEKPSLEVERSAVGRIELRDALLEGLSNPSSKTIQWGRTFTEYTQLEDGQVRAYFSDGSHEDCDLLVGADGPNSKVRQQFMPNLNRLDLGIQAIAGRYILDDEKMLKLPTELTNGSLNNIVPYGKGWMFISSWGSKQTNSKDQHYVLWAYVVPVDRVAWTCEETDLKDSVLRNISQWAPELNELVNGTDPSTIKRLPIRTMPNLASWEPGNITLIGDAIHNMTPMAGIGANTALRDAEVLTRCLIDVAAGRLGLTDGVGVYESTMRRYANEALKLSTRNAINACEGGMAQRFLFRNFLRAAHSFPVIMRATLGRQIE
ncbi:unnamed protein product [Clonostachys rosea f. rosea IK726]|uniref:FAD-binding domain-containing protein n=2 Tax=Bionectria ochroleuca TaxID=29856 RepID=A0A0B7KQC5_BIOOC|nr:unnamed protein product [Clonostachys rosea f. rosea IK726]